MFHQPATHKLVGHSDAEDTIREGQRCELFEPRGVLRGVNTLADDLLHFVPDVVGILLVIVLACPVRLKFNEFALGHGPAPMSSLGLLLCDLLPCLPKAL